MQVIENILETEVAAPGVVLTIGSFDGVHLGHQRILRELIQTARRENAPVAVMTMRPHPREVFSPDHPPYLLTAEKKKLELFAAFGVDLACILPFDLEVASMEPRAFVLDVVLAHCHAKTLIIGHDFHFGRGARGDFDFLAEMGRECGFRVAQVPALFVEGECVSSTAIRERLLEGDLEKAEAFLGRKYSIVGEVVSGRGIGVKLGFPTANIRPFHTAVPAQGVYAAQAILGNQVYSAAVNIGIAPTIQHEDIVIEAHVMDFAGEPDASTGTDLRGREIELVFHKRLRPEKKFNSHQELIEAIAQDVETIRRYFAR